MRRTEAPPCPPPSSPDEVPPAPPLLPAEHPTRATAAQAIAATREQWWLQPTTPRSTVDTTGCGDAFAAGFLFGWCGSRDVRRGLVYGCACGTAAVGQVGGSTPLDASVVDDSMAHSEDSRLERLAFRSFRDEPMR